VGCATCANTGYRGRIPLVEVLVSNPQFAELVATAATPPILKAVYVLREHINFVRNRLSATT